MGKGRNHKPTEEELDDPHKVLPSGEYFANGLPKVVHWYEMDGDIHVVLNKDGERQHVFEDVWLSLDLKRSFHIYHYWEFRAPYGLRCDPNAKREWDFSTDYCNSDVEAAERAVREQQYLARHEKAYVPIYVRI